MTEERGVASNSVHGSSAELSRISAEAAVYLDGWQRARADYENLHRRSEEERQAARAEGMQEAFRDVLDVVDHFDRALAVVPAELAAHPWVAGIQQIRQGLTGVLRAQGIEVIEHAEGPLDPVRHEVVAQAPSASPAGTIVQVVARGYVRDGRVLRPARVTVSTGRGPGSER